MQETVTAAVWNSGKSWQMRCFQINMLADFLISSTFLQHYCHLVTLIKPLDAVITSPHTCVIYYA